MMFPVKKKTKDLLKNTSEETLRVSVSIAALSLISLHSRIEMLIPDAVILTLAGVAVYTATEAIVHRAIERRFKDPGPKVGSVLAGLVLAVFSTLISTEIEAIIVIIIGSALYTVFGYRSLVAEEDSPIEQLRHGNYKGAIGSALPHLLWLFLTSGFMLVILLASVALVAVL